MAKQIHHISLHYIPAVLASMMLLTLACTYYWSTKRGDWPRWLPYISDTGTLQPESTLFTFGLSSTAWLHAWFSGCVYTVFMHKLPAVASKHGWSDSKLNRFQWLNNAYLVIALLGSLGLTGVAAVQETAAEMVHCTFAGIFFVGTHST
eukprot:GABW01001106.1.p1 GENE.GABW01001106.1~~GABW01001106.1.p1  ORF type:complete len:149 (-),score=22.86 GABW01001106.1:3-449(-)